MSEKRGEGATAGAKPAKDAKPRPYERPRIIWREPYEPVAFGFSCAKQTGNSQCQGGPGTV